MENTKNNNERFIHNEHNLKCLKFKRNDIIEQDACNSIVSFLRTEQACKMDPKELMSLVLEQIQAACMLTISTEETGEHRMLKCTNEYLNHKINKIDSATVSVVKTNTLNECIKCLKNIAEDALNFPGGKVVMERLYYFVDSLQKE